MPSGSRIVLRVAAEADIPTPDSDQTALFMDSDASNAPAYKDDTGTVTLLKGEDGALTLNDIGNTGASETVDADAAPIQSLVLDAATVAITLSTAVASGTPVLLRLILEQDGAGGREVDWSANTIDWGTPGEPVLQTGAGAIDVIDFMSVDGGTTWIGLQAGRVGPTGPTGPSGSIGTDYASASTNAGQSFGHNATIAIVDFEDVEFDPGSDITTGASWHYTCPTTGIYRVSAQTSFAGSTAWSAAGERGLLQLFKNGNAYRTLDRKDGYITAGASMLMVLGGTTLISLSAGDTIDVRLTQNSGSTIALTTNNTDNYIDIQRIG